MAANIKTQNFARLYNLLMMLNKVSRAMHMRCWSLSVDQWIEFKYVFPHLCDGIQILHLLLLPSGLFLHCCRLAVSSLWRLFRRHWHTTLCLLMLTRQLLLLPSHGFCSVMSNLLCMCSFTSSIGRPLSHFGLMLATFSEVT